MTFNLILGLIASTILIWLAVIKLFEIQKLNLTIKNNSRIIKNLETSDRKKIIHQINKLRQYHSDWALITFADKYSWSSLIVSCLPKLYFSKQTNPITSYVWKEVLNLVPPNYHYEIINKYCDGQLLKIKLPTESHEIVNELAIRLEEARLNSPFSSYISLLGVINQHLNDYELKIKKQKNSNLAKQIQSQRKEFLKEELDLSIYSAN